jgi:hypothetical protein
MSTKLIKTSCALALSLALASGAFARAEAPQDSSGSTPTKTATTTKAGNTVKHHGETTLANGQSITRDATVVREGNTVTRDATVTGPNGGTTMSHSIHDWQPGSLGRPATQTTQITRTHTEPAEPQQRRLSSHPHHAANSEPAQEVKP